MATTTPNFGWSVPTSSDLVKNGAVAIETLGDSIDASMVDLKGGTTGQVLSKTSATDMDFTWTTASSGSGYAAGKNVFINGDFKIWQRGTTFTFTSSDAYTADRFLVSAGSGGTVTVSQQTFTPGTAPVAGYEGSTYLQAAYSVSGTGCLIYQKIEDVRAFADQTVTVSFWARITSGTKASCYIDAVQNFGSGGSGAVVNSSTSPTFTLTTTWTRFTQVIPIASIAGKTIGTSSFLYPRFNFGTSGTSTYQTWGWQIEEGSTATTFQTATGTVQGELAACQRYYRKSYQQGTAPATATTGPGLIVTPAAATVANQDNYGSVQFDIKMRTAPTVTIYPYTTPSNTARVSNGSGTDLAAASGTVVLTSDSGFYSKNNSGGAVLSSLGVILYHYTADAEL